MTAQTIIDDTVAVQDATTYLNEATAAATVIQSNQQSLVTMQQSMNGIIAGAMQQVQAVEALQDPSFTSNNVLSANVGTDITTCLQPITQVIFNTAADHARVSTLATFGANQANFASNKIYITNQSIAYLGVNSSLKQSLNLGLTVGANVNAKIYNVDVNCGPVHAYTDQLSLANAGPNGSHRMPLSLSIIQVQYVTPDHNGNLIPTAFIQNSNPSPVVQLNSISLGDVSYNPASQTASLTISGQVTDDIAQITGDGSGDIQTATIYAEGEELAVVSLNKVSDATSLLKPYAHHYEFSQQVTVNVQNSMFTTVEVVTSENKLNNTGRSAVLITQDFTALSSSGAGGSSASATISIQGGLSSTSINSILYSPIDGSEPLELIENTVGSLQFIDIANTEEIDILSPASIDPTIAVVLNVRVTDLFTGAQNLWQFSETAPNSDIFTMSLPVQSGDGGNTAYVSSLSDVSLLPERSANGPYIPYLFRMKGSKVDQLQITIDGSQYTTTQQPDGYYYLQWIPHQSLHRQWKNLGPRRSCEGQKSRESIHDRWLAQCSLRAIER